MAKEAKQEEAPDKGDDTKRKGTGVREKQRVATARVRRERRENSIRKQSFHLARANTNKMN